MPKSTPEDLVACGRFQPRQLGMEALDLEDSTVQEAPQTPTPYSPCASFASLPTEIRIEIWRCTIQPQLVFFDEVKQRPRDFTLPVGSQVNKLSRDICLPFYERVGKGPYFQFSKDIFICDPSIAEEPSNDFVDTLALRVQRLAFWDCFPDDSAVACPSRFEFNLWSTLGRRIAERIDFGGLWFPNLKELWVVKIGDVDESWGIKRDKNASRQDQFRQLARQFRYWVEEGILEMAPLNLAESDTNFLLQNGRCGDQDCREVNYLRPMMVSRVTFMDSPYQSRKPESSTNWLRVEPRKSNMPGMCDGDEEAEARRMRWAMVERVLFFILRSDCVNGHEGSGVAPARTRTVGSD